MPDFVDRPENLPADKTTLVQAVDKAGSAGLTYLYDFGDDWEHEITASPPSDADPTTTYPRLVQISGNCPPEDIGGPPGYEMFLEAMTYLKHPEHKDLKAWYGGPFDPGKPNEKALKANVTKLTKRWLA